jgi:crossover junction endodeoxyribonuclease RuvC
MSTHLPDVIAIERVFSNANANTAMGTAQAAGVIALAAARRDIDVYFHTPSEVKAAVTGNGRADKAQVASMVARLLGLDDPPRPADATDALALAITQIWRGSSEDRLTHAVNAGRIDRTGDRS